MRSRLGLVEREVATRKWTSRPGWNGDKVGSLERRLDVATSILKSRHGWLQGTSRHGRMASRRSRNGAKLIGCRDIILRSRHG